MQLSAISLAITRIGQTGGFSPLSLFAASEVGAWYDPSDLTTMFQDRAGTTPVTADGQTVGLILDKSKGLVLGYELVTNGDFSNGDTGWELTNTTVSGGSVAFSGAAWAYIKQTGMLSVLTNKFCKATFTVLSGSGQIAVKFGSSSNQYVNVTGQGTYTAYGYVSGSLDFYLQSTATVFTGTIDNISVKELPGNHAVAPSDAARQLYKTDGTYHWMQFDGTDDSFATEAINFAATDKMSIFAGVRKNTDSGNGMVCEISPNNGNGSFYFLAPAAGANYQFGLTGTVGTVAGTATTFTSPTTNVISGAFDFAGALAADEMAMRVNGSLKTLSYSGAASAGTANFSNYKLYIGQRGGASLPLNGRIYSLIVRGALSTADDIAKTEAWVNSKTGAY